MVRLAARLIHPGRARGTVLRSPSPIGFFGQVDPETGRVTEPGHPLEGVSIAGRVLVFPAAKGSTVGSYVLYALGRRGLAPAAMLLERADTIVAVGAILGGIPTFDRVDPAALADGQIVEVLGATVWRAEEAAEEEGEEA